MLVPTGTRINLPAGFVGYVTPRSGLAHKHGITVLNAPGVVDAGYTGEIKVNLINLGTEEVKLVEGERVAQFVVQPVTLAKFTQVPAFGVRYGDRGERGHGSTGTT